MTDVTLRYLLFGDDRSASKAVKGFESNASRSSKVVGASFAKMGGLIGGEVGDLISKAGEGLTSLGESAKGMGPKLQASGAAVAGLGAGLSILGSADKSAEAALSAAMTAAGSSTEEYGKQIDEVVSKQESYAHSAASTKQALATLVEATGSPKKAIESMGLVADVAAAKHTDLNSAAVMVAKTLNGSGRLFKQYGVEVVTNRGHITNLTQATAELAAKLHGQADASVNSFSGRLSVLKTKIEDGAAAFGNKFGPALQAGGIALMAVGTVLEIVRGRQAAAAVATNAETVAVEGQSIASKAAAAAQWLLNAAMDANPATVLVAALVGIVAVFVLLYKHSTTFRNAMNAAFRVVTEAASVAFNWIKQHWPLILAILTGPFGIAVLLIARNWSKISTAAATVITAIKTAWNGFIGFLTGIPARVSTIAGSMWSSIGSTFRSMINGIIDIWNGLHFTIPSVHIFGKTIGGGTIGVPQIPHLATGGTLTSAGAVMVGENGPEYLRLPQGAQVRPLAAGPGGGAGGDLGTLTLVVKSETGAVLEQKLIRFQRQAGNRPLGFVTVTG